VLCRIKQGSGLASIISSGSVPRVLSLFQQENDSRLNTISFDYQVLGLCAMLLILYQKIEKKMPS
jgi:hypothetical protein